MTGALSFYEKLLQVPGRPLPLLVVKVSPQSHKAHCRTTDTGTETMALSTATRQLKRVTQTALKQNVPVQTDLPWNPLEMLSFQRITVCTTKHLYTHPFKNHTKTRSTLPLNFSSQAWAITAWPPFVPSVTRRADRPCGDCQLPHSLLGVPPP